MLGRVADPTGAVLAEAAVRLTNQATGVARDTKTNASGDYSFHESCESRSWTGFRAAEARTERHIARCRG